MNPPGGRLREAVDRVLRDVEMMLGSGAIGVALVHQPDSFPALESRQPGLLDLLTNLASGRTGQDSEGWTYVPGEPGAVGLVEFDSEPFANLLVRVAEAMQEVLVESRRWRGTPFPTCPVHGTHPLWPEVRGAKGVWACAKDDQIVVRIGLIPRPSDDPGGDA